jgi:hypothetical protein
MHSEEDTQYLLPAWAHRLRKSQIARLYRSSARGVIDDDLIDEVGYALLARCESMLGVGAAIRGRPPCPACGASARLDRGAAVTARCGECGWKCPWPLYKKTYQRKNLNCGGLAPFVEEFLRRFPAARCHREKLVLIDTLIHRFHWESETGSGGRPGACNLIEGKLKDIMPFLDRLSYGDSIPPEVAQTREDWRRKWTSNAWSKGKGQQPKKRTPGED